jgi:hypothetical protein
MFITAKKMTYSKIVPKWRIPVHTQSGSEILLKQTPKDFADLLINYFIAGENKYVNCMIATIHCIYSFQQSVKFHFSNLQICNIQDLISYFYLQLFLLWNFWKQNLYWSTLYSTQNSFIHNKVLFFPAELFHV